MKVATVEEMRAMDSSAVENFKIPELILMENAGNAGYEILREELDIHKSRFLVICGAGNNGGDGKVIARKLHSNGALVEVIFLSKKEKLQGINKKNHIMIENTGIKIHENPSPSLILEKIEESDVIVDSMLGTGLTGKVRGIYLDTIKMINDSKKTVLSVDIPSGINGDTGEVMGDAVMSDFTITFGLPKVGNLEYPGFKHCGKLYVTHISFPPSLYDSDSLKIETNSLMEIPEREEDSHKGTFGKCLFISGCKKYLGAPYFSAMSYLKAGGGLSYLATPLSISPFIAGKGSEIVIVPQKETDEGSLSSENLDNLIEFSKTVDFVVLGQGVSLNEDTQNLVRELSRKINKPLLLDGDGITAVSKNPEILKERENYTVITPHPGEFSRITGKSIDEIKSNRIKIIQEYTSKLGISIVLKGAHSIAGFPDGRTFINLTGNSGLASAGSGDVLTGTIGAFYGLGLDADSSVRMGVFAHGLSGDLASSDIGEDGITASDVLYYLPEALELMRDNSGILKTFIEVV